MVSERVILSFPFKEMAKGSLAPVGTVSIWGSIHTRCLLFPFGVQRTRVVKSEKDNTILFPSSPRTSIFLDFILVYSLVSERVLSLHLKQSQPNSSSKEEKVNRGVWIKKPVWKPRDMGIGNSDVFVIVIEWVSVCSSRVNEVCVLKEKG